MRPTEAGPALVRFGRFELQPQRRELLADGVQVQLGSRAFDVLVALIEGRGELVTKDELLTRVWPGTAVEEGNLQVQVSTLRKALGEDRDVIRTIPGRGYRFVADITTVAASRDATADDGPAVAGRAPPSNLPATASSLIGREAELADVVELSSLHRLVTLTGAGGIGKTRLGIETARRMAPNFAHGVWIAELAPLSDPQLVAATVATVLGLELAAGPVSPGRVADALGPKRLLLVLDNCEHVIDAAAAMAEALVRSGTGVRVLATSREPLGAEAECVYRVPPLDVPGEDTVDPEALLRHGAVLLFVARAREAESQFTPDHRVAALAAAVCRRLDGIPLAIELAAARAATLGVEGLAARLGDRFRLLTGGRRTALPRQQTLRATLDWSHDLLSEPERVVLRRLAVFAGGFTLEAAAAVAAGGDIAEDDVAGTVAQLVAKSLVAADIGGAVAIFRLLETTRAYAFEKLVDSGELGAVARRHAEYYCGLLERAEAEWDARPAAEWLADHGRGLDNLRAALTWAFGPAGDPAIGAAMVAASTRLWINLSLLGESRDWIERALPHLDAASELGRQRAMLLYAALGMSLVHTQGSVHETAAAWNRACELAEQLRDSEYQLQARFGLYAYHLRAGEYGLGLQQAQAFRHIAGSGQADVANVLTGERMIGTALLYMGELRAARSRLDHVLERFERPGSRWRAIRFGLDQRVGALIHLARALWLQGFPDQALRVARSSVEEAHAVDHATSICFALADAACPVAALAGDQDAGTEFVSMLIDRAERHSFGAWLAHGRELQSMLYTRPRDTAGRAPLPEPALDRLREVRFDMAHLAILKDVADGAGDRAEACLSTVSEILDRAHRNEERWCIPELLRIKAELLVSMRTPDALADAMHALHESLRLAREQHALSWELRSATSLAGLWHAHGRAAEAYQLLSPVYARFTEGFATADLRAAAALIDRTH
jgi:predicted ATPase/DNA-binding winged helix-turn-helix (wHTH) protein